MKEQEQIIAISEACPHVCHKSLNPDVGYCWNNGTPFAHSRFDPLNDLNAMHEAEKILEVPQQKEYEQIVSDLTCTMFKLHASATVRAEAFLRTLKLWK